jgi:hypothetical protein
MKSLYPIGQVMLLPATTTLRNITRHIFLLWFICFAISSAYGQGLVFQNARLVAGKAGADKAVYRFPNVKLGLDALVTIKGRSDAKVSLTNIDVTSSGHSQSFQPQVSYNGGTAPGRAKWYMDFEVTLVKAGTNVRTEVSEIDATALDIDGNGDKIREYIIFNDPINVITETVSSLKIDEDPIIDFDAEDGDPVMCGSCNKASALVLCSSCSGSGLISTLINGLLNSSTCSKCNGSGKLHSLCGCPYKPSNSGKGSGKSFTYTGPTTNYANIDTFATQVMVTGTWGNTDEVVFRIGAENLSTSSQGAAERMYSLWFKEFRYIGAAMLPVKLSDWKAAMAKSNVLLNWTAELERNTSHFVVERSFDGSTFTAIGQVSAAGNSDVKKDYSYTDSKPGINAGVVYYRLSTVSSDGRTEYSAVRTVRIAAAATASTIAISTYPNPTVNALNITVPANWQGKTVTFEIFNVNGLLVKSVVNNHAGQVEHMHVSALSRGLYIVKATAGEVSATQRIVKSN